MAKKTVKSFKEAFHKQDAYYIFYVDDANYMYFLGDADSVDYDASELSDAIYTDSLADAVVCTYEQAKTLWFLCNYFFPQYNHHIVNIHTTLEWL